MGLQQNKIQQREEHVESLGGTNKPHMLEECRGVWYGWSRVQSHEGRGEGGETEESGKVD